MDFSETRVNTEDPPLWVIPLPRKPGSHMRMIVFNPTTQPNPTS